MATPTRSDPLLMHPSAGARTPLRFTPLILQAPKAAGREDGQATASPARRNRIWELSSHLHCSIVGTCLSTTELRQVLGRTALPVDGASDHDLHGHGVLLARQHDAAGKMLQKTLDRRHRLAISQFGKARTVEDVRALWREAVRRGDIPGAYWATLTHPATTDALVRDVFGEVHMLSHLVGAANRADIRRLSALEAENADLQAKLQRQQDQLREGFSARDARIRELGALLARRIAEETEDGGAADGSSELATLTRLAGDLERRLAAERSRRGALEARLERVLEELRRERELHGAAEHREGVLREELDAVEASFVPAADTGSAAVNAPAGLGGLSLLYVGGRPGQVSHLRALSEQHGAEFLHHDGGIDDRAGLLAGLVSRADIVLFPVDCVSHEAVAMVKRLCRQSLKPYVPLRSAGLSSFVAALGRTDVASRHAGARVMALS